MITTSQELFDEVQKAIHYSDTCRMKPLKEMKKIGFFPGGSGMWNGEGTLAEKDVLILGQDFGNEKTYQDFERKEGNKERSEDPEKSATWRNLLPLLDELGIAPSRCFFSNVFMGLRDKDIKPYGACPGIDDAKYYKTNQVFLRTQIDTLNPKLIILLGEQPVRFFEKAFSENVPVWKDFKTMSELLKGAEKSPVVEAEILGRKRLLAAVIHPSFNGVNRSIIFREIAKKKGRQAEETRRLNECLEEKAFRREKKS